MYSGKVVTERAKGAHEVDLRTKYIGPRPKMAELRNTHDIFCKIRPKEVFQVSVERRSDACRYEKSICPARYRTISTIIFSSINSRIHLSISNYLVSTFYAIPIENLRISVPRQLSNRKYKRTF